MRKVVVYTLISLLLIGRGLFCGWLCPFGALQELLAQVARAAHLPQFNPRPAFEKRLWLEAEDVVEDLLLLQEGEVAG